ncbi:MAG: sugar ABC transporter permease [Chloroflexota bacterium]
MPGVQARAASVVAGLRRDETRWGLAFLSPWIIGFVVFTAGPMLASLLLSFTDADGLAMTPDHVVGLDNYAAMARDPLVWTTLGNTLFFAVLYIPLSIGLALGLALLLDRVKVGTGLFRTLFYLPNVMPAVAVGALFLLLLNGRSGLLNQVLRSVGLPAPSWLNDPAWMKPGIVLMMLWSIGGTIVIHYAALRNVPKEQREAAMIDGAGAWARFRHVTLPYISGALFFTLVINTIAALQLFAEVYAMFFGRQTSGASAQSALFYVIYLFRNAFEFGRMGYASALAWLLFLVVVIITVVQVRTSRRWVYLEGSAS